MQECLNGNSTIKDDCIRELYKIIEDHREKFHGQSRTVKQLSKRVEQSWGKVEIDFEKKKAEDKLKELEEAA